MRSKCPPKQTLSLLLSKGLTTADLSKHFEVSKGTIIRWKRTYKLFINPRLGPRYSYNDYYLWYQLRFTDPPLSCEEIAIKFKCGSDHVRKVTNILRRDWNEGKP